MPAGFIDTHAHYDDKAFKNELDSVMKALPAAGVRAVINCACDPKSIRSTLKLAEQYRFVYAALGYHPENIKGFEYDDIDFLYDKLEGNSKVVAIGEVGLDYHWNKDLKEEQQEWFVEQIEIAKEYELPLIVHSRDAADDTLRILKETNAAYAGGVMHAFSGGAELAAQYVEMGFYIGIGGFVTYENAKKLVKAVPEIPLDRLLIETDCPYTSPEPLRGSRNDSRNILYTAEKIALLKGISTDEVLEATTVNAARLFHIKLN